MKTHEEMIEEVYNDTSYRSEFKSYVNLTKAIKSDIAARVLTTPPWAKDKLSGVTYEQLVMGFSDMPVEFTKRLHNAQILYYSLEKALSIKYALDHKRAKHLVLDIANRYEQG